MNPNNNKWTKGPTASEPSEEELAARRKAEREKEREAIEKEDELAEEKALRRADKMNAFARERSGSRGKSATSRGSQKASLARGRIKTRNRTASRRRLGRKGREKENERSQKITKT